MTAAAKLPYPPLNFAREDALAYTGWAPKFFDMLVRTGQLKGRAIGPHGATVYSRARLEEIDAALAGDAPANDIDDEFEGLGNG